VYVREKESERERGLFLYALLHSYSLCVMPLSTFSLESDEEKEEDDREKDKKEVILRKKRSIFCSISLSGSRCSFLSNPSISNSRKCHNEDVGGCKK
jgi:hypothetical protein